ncbi:MAG: hypothetical protein ABIQ16_17230, partial [Polyangiaceae bacterium]
MIAPNPPRPARLNRSLLGRSALVLVFASACSQTLPSREQTSTKPPVLPAKGEEARALAEPERESRRKDSNAPLEIAAADAPGDQAAMAAAPTPSPAP